MKKETEFFAERMKCRRREIGLTQKELAARLGYSEKTISKWESGEVIAPSIVLMKLATVLETDVNYLLSTAHEQYYLGVDGGGSKTEFVLTDEHGATVSSILLEGCNPVDIGMDAATNILARGIKATCGNIPMSSVSAFFGIAGGTTGDNRERLRDFLKKYGFAYFDNGSDAQNAVSAALGDGNGSIVIMGTGSIAFSQMDGRLVRRGGYGYIFERGGSGFAIGRDAVTATLEAEECGEGGALRDELCAELGVSRISDSVQGLYMGGKRKIASLAPAVFRAYKAGDPDASRILSENMYSVARLIESTPKTEQNAEKQRIVIVGGLTTFGDELLPLILRGLSAPREYDISFTTQRPVVGALNLARKGKGGTPC